MQLPTSSAFVLRYLPAPPSVLVCFSHLRWAFVYQRPQHLLSRAAREHSVFFIEEPLFEQACRTPRLDLRPQPCGVVVAVPILPEGLCEDEIIDAQRVLLDRLLAQQGKTGTIFWYYTPMAFAFSGHVEPDLCIYDCMDELSAFRGASPRLRELERALFKACDLVFTGGRSLFEAKRGCHANVHAFPSSVDAEHFANARTKGDIEPADQAGISPSRIGFFGVIDERMDLELVERVSRLRPDWQWVFLGPVVKIDPASLPAGDNIHWLGPKTYDELPAYLAGWNAGFMPFALNEATRFISPTKTLEFLAAGVPVVSTPIADVVNPYGAQRLVEIAGTPQTFVAALERILKREGPHWLARADAYLAKVSWDKTWAAMSLLIQQAEILTPETSPHLMREGVAHV